MRQGGIWVGYTQGGPLGPFGPTGIAPGGLHGGQKSTKNAIKRAFMAIGGSGGSKGLDLSGYWLDLGGIHPGWSVGAIWTHRNCPRGPPGGSETAQKCHKTPIYGHKWLRWLQMAGSQLILVGSGWDTSRMVCWGNLDPPNLSQGASRGVGKGIL